LLSNDLSKIIAGTIIVKSQLGTGKTKMLREYIKLCQQQQKSVIILSFRKTFSSDIASKFDVESYQDIQGNIMIAKR